MFYVDPNDTKVEACVMIYMSTKFQNFLLRISGDKQVWVAAV